MKFKPKSEQEIKDAQNQFLWPVGEYAFEILESEEKTDKNDNPMFALKVKLFKDDGKSQNVFEYVSPVWMEHKLRHLAECTGLLAEYEQGELEAYELVGKTGMCKVNVSKDKTGQYPDKNGISDYIVDRPSDPRHVDIKDDSIPF